MDGIYTENGNSNNTNHEVSPHQSVECDPFPVDESFTKMFPCYSQTSLTSLLEGESTFSSLLDGDITDDEIAGKIPLFILYALATVLHSSLNYIYYF